MPAALNTAGTDPLLDTTAGGNSGGDNGFTSENALLKVRISSTAIKMYVDAYDDSNAASGNINDLNLDSTYTMYYSVNNGATVTIGTYSRTTATASPPFIYMDNLADGTYAFKVWAVANAKSNSKTAGAVTSKNSVPSATDAATMTNAATPLQLTVIVDTTMPVTSILTNPGPYSNSATGTLTLTCSKAATANTDLSGGYIQWYFSWAGSAYATTTALPDITAAGFQSTYTYSLTGRPDGAYTFSAYCKWIGYAKTDATIRAGYTETTNPRASVTWTYDTTPPTVAVQAGPGVGSAASLFKYPTSGTTSFTFSCNDELGLACTYKCALDGKATADATALATASKGYYTCTSGHTITLAKDTTTTFHVYATDLAGNVSPLSQMYSYSNDNTAPLVGFTKMDESETLNTATTTSNALESFGGYYPNTLRTTNQANDIATGVANTFYQTLADGSTQLFDQTIATGAKVYNPVDSQATGTQIADTSGSTTDMLYDTVLQVPMDITDPVYDLTNNLSRSATDGYGVLLAARQVNGVAVGTTSYGAYYYNVLYRTNAPSGTLNFVCIHNEMANGDTISTIIESA